MPLKGNQEQLLEPKMALLQCLMPTRQARTKEKLGSSTAMKSPVNMRQEKEVDVLHQCLE
jgi:hypothetical protein